MFRCLYSTCAALVIALTGTCVAAGNMETAFWQNEINRRAATGGGRVVVPPGRHLVGQLELRSNVELHLEADAILEGAVGLEHYRLFTLPYSDGEWSAIVVGLGVTNVAITGTGQIFGNGTAWPEPPKNFPGCQEALRARGILLSECANVRLEDFTLRDAACWGLVLKNCDGVTARRVRIDSHGNWNNDGFDIEARNVLIEGCEADTGDDPFCIKSYDPAFAVENVTIRNCTARGQANCYKIGTATFGVVRNIRIENCRVDVPRRMFTQLADGSPAHLQFHYTCERSERYPNAFSLCALAFECVDGGCVEDVVCDGLELVDGVRIPIFIRADKRSGLENGIKPNTLHVLRNVVIKNVRGYAMGPMGSSIMGVDGFHVKDVLLKDIDIVVPGAGLDASRKALATPLPYLTNKYPTPDIFFPHIFPAYGLYIDRAENVKLENVRFRIKEGTEDVRPEIMGVYQIEDR